MSEPNPAGMHVDVGRLPHAPAAALSFEIVERKGLGHPDTICDAIAERIAVALCAAYRAKTGRVRHFNVDKSLLVAGRVDRRFGGGRVTAPMRLVVGDRADPAVPVEAIATHAARTWFRENLPLADAERDLVCQVEIQPTSPELAGIYDEPGAIPRANDSSAAVGYWPLSPLEALVLALEGWLTGPAFRQSHPEAGIDVKVLGTRRGRDVELTIAMPLLDAHVAGEADYFRRKASALEHIQAHVAALAPALWAPRIHLNTLDAPGRGMDGLYLSVIGTSAEDGDSGQVGRGNRVNGLISLTRPAPAEVAPGKNPRAHPGKVYNALAHALARRCVETVPGILEAHVWLASQIGAPLDRPHICAARVAPAPGVRLDRLQAPVRQVIEAGLADLAPFLDALERGVVPLF